MVRLANRVRHLLSRHEQRRLMLMLGIFVFVALLEAVGVLSVVPFMQLVARPGIVQDNEFLGSVYEAVGFNSERQMLVAVGIVVLFLMVATNLSQVLVLWYQQKVIWDITHRLGTKMMSIFLYQAYPFYLTHRSADLSKQILEEVRIFSTAFLQPAAQFAGSLMVTLVLVITLVVVDPLLALTVSGFMGSAYGVFYVFLRRRMHYYGQRRYRAGARRFKAAIEAFSSIKQVKIVGCEEFFVRRFERASRELTQIFPVTQVLSIGPGYAVRTLMFGGIVVIVLYLLFQAGSLQEAIPLLTLYAVAGYRMMPALQTVFKSVGTMRTQTPSVEAVYRDLRRPTASSHAEAANGQPIRVQESIELNDISFAYGADQEEVLRNVNVSIPVGSRVGFVGQTGSGKTTLVDIIVGLLDPVGGAVLVDGKPRDAIMLHRWLSVIGYVPQDVQLTDDTVGMNIAFGVEEANIDWDRVHLAAKTAQIHSFISEEMSEGYRTEVGERGVRLSGGQAQRIGLARALYRSPQLLVLDEATSALDGITEQAIMDAIMEMEEDITIIMIAHRLQTVKNCDAIYLMEHGRILNRGSYNALMQESEMFRDMARVNA